MLWQINAAVLLIAGNLAQAIKFLCDRYELEQDLPRDLHHYCGDQPTSWYAFSRAIFAIAKQQGGIEN